jgi:RecB family exonuclease
LNATTRFLADFCRAHPLEEKIFMVPSYPVGHQIGHSLADTGRPWANLRFMTLPALVHEASEAGLAAAGKTQLSQTELLTLVDRLFRGLREAGRLAYFGRLAPRPGIARALFRTVQDLRSARTGSGSLSPDDFVLAEKGREIILLLESYERSLEERGFLDLPGLYEFAVRNSRPAGDWVLAFADGVLTRLERDALRAVAGDRLVLVPRDPVIGLDRPRRCWPVSRPPSEHAAGRSAAGIPPAAQPTDSERLSWLFAPHAAPPAAADGTVRLFRAIGPANECREIVRRVLAGNISFDRVEIVHPRGPAYPAIFHALSVRTGLPVTIADGIPLAFTTPGRVFSGLADWLENDYLAAHLCRLIESGGLRFDVRNGEDSVSPQHISRFLKSAAIGWGRDRYTERLLALKAVYEAKLDPGHGGEGPDPEKIAGISKDIASIERLTSVIAEFLALFPAPGPSGEVDDRLFGRGLVAALRKHAHIRSDLDRRALDSLLAEIGRITGEERATPPPGAETPAFRLTDVLERLRTAVSSLFTGSSSPLAGHIHLSNHFSGGFSGRPETFVVGLDEEAYPGRPLQDPILLDGEREKISPDLPTTADSLRENLHSLAVLLASLRGRVTLSYSSYDIIGERTAFPSSLLLQAHRLIRSDATLDYSSLEEALPDASGYLPDETSKVLDEMDWWLARLAQGGRLLDGLAPVHKSFPLLSGGIEAAEARAGDRLTPFEGLVRLQGDLARRFNPLLNPGLLMSASRLELLAGCPYRYFLRYVLGVEPPEELEFDLSRWLDPLQRGSVLHEILYEFMREVTARQEKVDPSLHTGLIRDWADRVMRRWKASIPPPSEGIFEKERQDMIEALEVFLTAEKKRERPVEPVAFEKDFRDIEIPVASRRSFRLRGRIDRIDRLAPHAYRVVDYKTGSYVPFEDLVAFNQGKAVQHALYALAAEEIFRREGADPKPAVTESGYYFPTRRGEGREIMVECFDRNKLRELLADLFALIEKGYFIAGLSADCRFCDFAPICGGSPDEMKRKIATHPGVCAALEKLAEYE